MSRGTLSSLYKTKTQKSFNELTLMDYCKHWSFQGKRYKFDPFTRHNLLLVL